MAARKVLTLQGFYDTVNDKLRGTYLKNEAVKFVFMVKLPDEDKEVPLALVGTALGRIDNEPEGTLVFNLEVPKE